MLKGAKVFCRPVSNAAATRFPAALHQIVDLQLPRLSWSLHFRQRGGGRHRGVEEGVMAESVYKIIEIVGTSPTSWEKAATAAVERAASSLRDLRVAEVCEQDIVIADGKIEAFRVRLKVSFKYED
jgi:flavin-binding protein dodecin